MNDYAGEWGEARRAAVAKAHAMIDAIRPAAKTLAYSRDDWRMLRECAEVLVNLAPRGVLESPFVLHADANDEGEPDSPRPRAPHAQHDAERAELTAAVARLREQVAALEKRLEWAENTFAASDLEERREFVDALARKVDAEREEVAALRKVIGNANDDCNRHYDRQAEQHAALERKVDEQAADLLALGGARLPHAIRHNQQLRQTRDEDGSADDADGGDDEREHASFPQWTAIAREQQAARDGEA